MKIVIWPIGDLRKAWLHRRRQRALMALLSTLPAAEYESVRAYLSVNAGDEVFITTFLNSAPESMQRTR